MCLDPKFNTLIRPDLYIVHLVSNAYHIYGIDNYTIIVYK
jgi:hypothetical protein